MKLIESEEIVQCLINNESNFLDIPIPVDYDVTSLIYQQIFPYKFIPTTETEAKTFITMSFSYKPNGVTFKNGSVYFYIITHNSLLRTDYGSLRYDMLLNYIDEIFNSSRDITIGKLAFYDMGDFVVNDNYSGIYIVYRLVDFQ